METENNPGRDPYAGSQFGPALIKHGKVVFRESGTTLPRTFPFSLPTHSRRHYDAIRIVRMYDFAFFSDLDGRFAVLLCITSHGDHTRLSGSRLMIEADTSYSDVSFPLYTVECTMYNSLLYKYNQSQYGLNMLGMYDPGPISSDVRPS